MRISEIDLRIYRATQAIGNLIAAQNKGPASGGFWFADQRHLGIHPSWNQTAAGIYLLTSLQVPSSVITPWGVLTIVGSNGGSPAQLKAVTAIIMGALTAAEAPDVTAQIRKAYVRAYAVLGVGQLTLPQPNLRPRSQHIGDEAARNAWSAIARMAAAGTGPRR